MIKKILATVVSLLVLVVGSAFLFKDQLMGMITEEMFIAGDTDSFDPGLAIGGNFPAIKAVYQGREITSINEFISDTGMIFITNRSADW
ncbi:MAG: hypothetical protein ACJAUG_002651 [Halioglobus sp.]|jgi:hypothetical protein